MTTPQTPTRVLFVDDEPLVLQGLKRQLRKLRSTWSMRFAQSGAQALAMLETEPADVVVSDMRMPGIDGAELLSRVRKLYPDAVRFLLSGQTDQGTLMSGISSIHQFLQKPCEESILVHSIERARCLAKEIGSPRCMDLAGHLQSLPVLSSTLADLRIAIGEEADAATLGTIVDSDPGLSCKLLQLVNSAFFGIPRKVESSVMAISLLGIQQLESLACSLAVFDAIGKGDASSARIEELWSQCANLGSVAYSLAAEDGRSQEFRSNVRLAGMLSHIGRAMLIRSMPSEFDQTLNQVHDSGMSLRDSERAVFGTDQDVLSAYLLGLWAFSDPLIEGVRWQSDPASSNHPDGGVIGSYIFRARLTLPATELFEHPELLQEEQTSERRVG